MYECVIFANVCQTSTFISLFIALADVSVFFLFVHK